MTYADGNSCSDLGLAQQCGRAIVLLPVLFIVGPTKYQKHSSLLSLLPQIYKSIN